MSAGGLGGGARRGDADVRRRRLSRMDGGRRSAGPGVACVANTTSVGRGRPSRLTVRRLSSYCLTWRRTRGSSAGIRADVDARRRSCGSSTPPRRARAVGHRPRSPSTTSPASRACRGRRSTACSPAARTCSSRRCGCTSSRSSSPCSQREVDGATSLEDLLVRTVVTRHPAAARRRPPRPDAGLRARRAWSAAHRRGPAADHPLRRRAAPAARRRPYLPRADVADADRRAVARLTISYFLAPSDVVDLGDEESARRFLAPLVALFGHERTHQARLQPSQGALP